MRIAHVSDCYAPRTGGIETQVRALAVHQAAWGDEVRVVTATPGHSGVFAGDDVVDGLPVHRLAARLPFELPVHPRTVTEVGRLLDRHPVDVVHVHAGVISPFAWGAVRAATKRGIPTLVTVHSVWGPLARPGFAGSDVLRAVDTLGGNAERRERVAADRISSALPGAGDVLIVPNGIDPAQWTVRPGAGRRPAPSGRERDADGPAQAHAAAGAHPRGGRRLARPGHAALRRCSSATGRSGRVRRSTCASTGSAIASGSPGGCRARASSRCSPRSDVYIQPSVKESFGLAALEARTAGLPVVARSQTGTSGFIHDGVQGLLADDDPGHGAGSRAAGARSRAPRPDHRAQSLDAAQRRVAQRSRDRGGCLPAEPARRRLAAQPIR